MREVSIDDAGTRGAQSTTRRDSAPNYHSGMRACRVYLLARSLHKDVSMRSIDELAAEIWVGG